MQQETQPKLILTPCFSTFKGSTSATPGLNESGMGTEKTQGKTRKIQDFPTKSCPALILIHPHSSSFIPSHPHSSHILILHHHHHAFDAYAWTIIIITSIIIIIILISLSIIISIILDHAASWYTFSMHTSIHRHLLDTLLSLHTQQPIPTTECSRRHKRNLYLHRVFLHSRGPLLEPQGSTEAEWELKKLKEKREKYKTFRQNLAPSLSSFILIHHSSSFIIHPHSSSSSSFKSCICMEHHHRSWSASSSSSAAAASSASSSASPFIMLHADLHVHIHNTYVHTHSLSLQAFLFKTHNNLRIQQNTTKDINEPYTYTAFFYTNGVLFWKPRSKRKRNPKWKALRKNAKKYKTFGESLASSWSSFNNLHHSLSIMHMHGASSTPSGSAYFHIYNT